MPKKKHWFFTVKGKGGCPPAFATGVDGTVNITLSGGGGTHIGYVRLSTITKASAGNIWQFENFSIGPGAFLFVDVTGIDLVQIICRTSCDIEGTIWFVRNGAVTPYPGYENNGSSISGTTLSGYSYSASIVQNAGGVGGGLYGGSNTVNGYGGGGQGSNTNGTMGWGGVLNGPGNANAVPGGAGDSTQGAGSPGGNASPTQDCTFGGTSGPGGAGGGSGGGGGNLTSVHHPATHDKFTSPAWDECTYYPGGGGGGEKGGHGGYLFLYLCGTITGGTGRLWAFGSPGFDGGSAGTGGAGGAGGGGGGAGGSGGHIWVECEAHTFASWGAQGGTGGAGGGGASGPTGNAGTITFIPI